MISTTVGGHVGIPSAVYFAFCYSCAIPSSAWPRRGGHVAIIADNGLNDHCTALEAVRALDAGDKTGQRGTTEAALHTSGDVVRTMPEAERLTLPVVVRKFDIVDGSYGERRKTPRRYRYT